jgi:hypothetical protein
VLTTTSTRATITSGSAAFGDLDTGQVGSNPAVPFTVKLAATTPYAADIPFRLTLSGASGYSLALDFSVRVRSAVETLGSTSYSADTTWTSDKTYVLTGAVIVGEGVTLTIQPGTQIQVAADKFVRVDGTLIARGTAERPIVFSASDVTTPWAGIRFTTSATDAVFAPDGSYQSGSIIQHVDLSGASVGLTLNGRAPYLADNTFGKTPTAVDTGGNQAIRIERNTIAGGTLNVGGAATLVQNTLAGAGEACGINLSGGSPLVMQNVFDGCSIGGQVQFPAVLSNTVSGGGIGLGLSDSASGGHAPRPAFLRGPRLTGVSVGSAHSCALTEGGGVLCWGGNNSGQVGDSSTMDRSAPVGVTGLTSGAVAVSARGYYACALTAAGGVKCWGENGWGQLGDGTTTGRTAPVPVVGLDSGVATLSAGDHHACVVTTAGST